MEANTEQHDATTGFHDIKAVPWIAGVHGPTDYFVATGFLLGCLFTLLLLRWLKRKKRPVPVNIESALDAFRRKLGRIRNISPAGIIETRRLALELSEAVRAYLEAMLPCPATELTPAELRSRLQECLSGAFPAASPAALDQYNEEIFRLLKQLERLSFGTEEVVRGTSRDLPQLIDEGERLVMTVVSWLQSEAARKAGGGDAPIAGEARHAI